VPRAVTSYAMHTDDDGMDGCLELVAPEAQQPENAPCEFFPIFMLRGGTEQLGFASVPLPRGARCGRMDLP